LTNEKFWNNGLSKYLMHFICKIDVYTSFTKLISASGPPSGEAVGILIFAVPESALLHLQKKAGFTGCD